MFGDADLNYLVGRDFAVAVVYQGQRVMWQFDTRGQDVLAGHVSGISASEPSIFGPSAGLTGLEIGKPIMVDGLAYVIRNVQPEDASTVRVYLKRA